MYKLCFSSDSAILQVQSINVKNSYASRSKRAGNIKKSKLKSLGTDENITVLHALGRVFNPKCKLISK